MEQLYKVGEEIPIIDNGERTIGKILGTKGNGIFRKYAVGLKRTDRIMNITYKTTAVFTEKELQNMLSVQNKETEEPEKAGIRMGKSNRLKLKLRNMLLGAMTLLLSVIVMIYSFNTENNIEKVLYFALTIIGITIGAVLIWCEWKSIREEIVDVRASKGKIPTLNLQPNKLVVGMAGSGKKIAIKQITGVESKDEKKGEMTNDAW